MNSIVDGDPTMRTLQFSLDGLAQRAQVASNDIANADTPNFKASVVTFEDSLRQALAGQPGDTLPLTLTDGADIDPNAPSGQAAITETPLLNQVMKNDNNNVDIEREMTTLAEANINYDALSQMASTKLAILRSSIQDVKP